MTFSPISSITSSSLPSFGKEPVSSGDKEIPLVQTDAPIPKKELVQEEPQIMYHIAGHILGGFDIAQLSFGGATFEGAERREMLQYIKTKLDSIKDDSAIKNIKKELTIALEVNQIGIHIGSTSKKWEEKASVFYKNISDQIQKLPIGEAILLEGGWEEHAMLYRIVRTDENNFYFEIYNTGSGVHLHPYVEKDGRHLFVQKLHKKLSKEEVLNPLFWYSYQQLIYETNHPGSHSIGATQAYSLFNLMSENFLEKASRETVTDTVLLRRAQHASTCSFDSFLAYAKTNLPTPAYQSMKLHLQKEVLIDYFSFLDAEHQEIFNPKNSDPYSKEAAKQFLVLLDSVAAKIRNLEISLAKAIKKHKIHHSDSNKIIVELNKRKEQLKITQQSLELNAQGKWFNSKTRCEEPVDGVDDENLSVTPLPPTTTAQADGVVETIASATSLSELLRAISAKDKCTNLQSFSLAFLTSFAKLLYEQKSQEQNLENAIASIQCLVIAIRLAKEAKDPILLSHKIDQRIWRALFESVVEKAKTKVQRDLLQPYKLLLETETEKDGLFQELFTDSGEIEVDFSDPEPTKGSLVSTIYSHLRTDPEAYQLLKTGPMAGASDQSIGAIALQDHMSPIFQQMLHVLVHFRGAWSHGIETTCPYQLQWKPVLNDSSTYLALSARFGLPKSLPLEEEIAVLPVVQKKGLEEERLDTSFLNDAFPTALDFDPEAELFGKKKEDDEEQFVPTRLSFPSLGMEFIQESGVWMGQGKYEGWSIASEQYISSVPHTYAKLILQNKGKIRKALFPAGTMQLDTDLSKPMECLFHRPTNDRYYEFALDEKGRLTPKQEEGFTKEESLFLAYLFFHNRRPIAVFQHLRRVENTKSISHYTVVEWNLLRQLIQATQHRLDLDSVCIFLKSYCLYEEAVNARNSLKQPILSAQEKREREWLEKWFSKVSAQPQVEVYSDGMVSRRSEMSLHLKEWAFLRKKFPLKSPTLPISRQEETLDRASLDKILKDPTLPRKGNIHLLQEKPLAVMEEFSVLASHFSDFYLIAINGDPRQKEELKKWLLAVRAMKNRSAFVHPPLHAPFVNIFIKMLTMSKAEVAKLPHLDQIFGENGTKFQGELYEKLSLIQLLPQPLPSLTPKNITDFRLLAKPASLRSKMDVSKKLKEKERIFRLNSIKLFISNYVYKNYHKNKIEELVSESTKAFEDARDLVLANVSAESILPALGISKADEQMHTLQKNTDGLEILDWVDLLALFARGDAQAYLQKRPEWTMEDASFIYASTCKCLRNQLKQAHYKNVQKKIINEKSKNFSISDPGRSEVDFSACPIALLYETMSGAVLQQKQIVSLGNFIGGGLNEYDASATQDRPVLLAFLAAQSIASKRKGLALFICPENIDPAEDELQKNVQTKILQDSPKIHWGNFSLENIKHMQEQLAWAMEQRLMVRVAPEELTHFLEQAEGLQSVMPKDETARSLDAIVKILKDSGIGVTAPSVIVNRSWEDALKAICQVLDKPVQSKHLMEPSTVEMSLHQQDKALPTVPSVPTIPSVDPIHEPPTVPLDLPFPQSSSESNGVNPVGSNPAIFSTVLPEESALSSSPIPLQKAPDRILTYSKTLKSTDTFAEVSAISIDQQMKNPDETSSKSSPKPTAIDHSVLEMAEISESLTKEPPDSEWFQDPITTVPLDLPFSQSSSESNGVHPVGSNPAISSTVLPEESALSSSPIPLQKAPDRILTYSETLKSTDTFAEVYSTSIDQQMKNPDETSSKSSPKPTAIDHSVLEMAEISESSTKEPLDSERFQDRSTTVPLDLPFPRSRSTDFMHEVGKTQQTETEFFSTPSEKASLASDIPPSIPLIQEKVSVFSRVWHFFTAPVRVVGRLIAWVMKKGRGLI